MKIPIFPGKYHQNGGFSMAMLVYRRVVARFPGGVRKVPFFLPRFTTAYQLQSLVFGKKNQPPSSTNNGPKHTCLRLYQKKQRSTKNAPQENGRK